MERIKFLGIGPSPKEVDSYYVGQGVIDLPPPVFEENYGGEFASMYRANGYEQVYGVYAPVDSCLTIRQQAMRLLPYCLAGEELVYGPLIIEDRVVAGGFSWWRQSQQTLSHSTGIR